MVGTIFIILIFSSYFFYKLTFNIDNSSNVIATNSENKNNVSRQAANTIAYGLKNTKGEHIDNGSNIIPHNNIISVNVSIDHNLDENREYGLIVLEDFKQVPFKIENKQEFTKYFFNMSPNTSKYIKVTLPVNSNAREVIFLLIKKPNYKLKELDINRAVILEEVLSMRYSINQAAKDTDNVKEKEPDSIITDGLNENMFVTKHKEKLQAVFVEKEGNELTFSVGNDTELPMRYAIVALRDWEQNTIIKDQDVIYTTVPSGVRHIFNFNLPNVDNDTNFQLIALPFPYEVSKENYISQQAFGSFRIVIQNKD
ncbi:hypothetical protein AWM68_17375 [Fictibacillus phosphorivorans]|uniref:Uncharacterized protein n=1 Tax=Fictibacillus phosphorivorans TaxID=1221500 RepID=A0A163S3C0_9BACL|nr:hypothetical protein AWM68_17375 [Fictibacillus phosphorivorans]